MRTPRTFLAAFGCAALFFVGGPASGADPDILKLDINAKCLNGVALFRIVNTGNRWPDSAMFNVYRAIDRTLINRRRLRMAKNQQASFRVSKGTHPGEELAIYVDPGWYRRQFRFDGKITCR